MSRPSPDYPMLPTIPLSAFSDPKKTKPSHGSKVSEAAGPVLGARWGPAVSPGSGRPASELDLPSPDSLPWPPLGAHLCPPGCPAPWSGGWPS